MEIDAEDLLWLHMVSEHAGVYNPGMNYRELNELHRHEHKGPGTIRNHSRFWHGWNRNKLFEVLSFESSIGA